MGRKQRPGSGNRVPGIRGRLRGRAIPDASGAASPHSMAAHHQGIGLPVQDRGGYGVRGPGAHDPMDSPDHGRHSGRLAQCNQLHLGQIVETEGFHLYLGFCSPYNVACGVQLGLGSASFF
jgi:hypothetical protein